MIINLGKRARNNHPAGPTTYPFCHARAEERYLLLDFSPIDSPVRDTLEFTLNA
jgi:hypothetical protein